MVCGEVEGGAELVLGSFLVKVWVVWKWVCLLLGDQSGSERRGWSSQNKHCSTEFILNEWEVNIFTIATDLCLWVSLLEQLL
jgi:hypothetical protein